MELMRTKKLEFIRTFLITIVCYANFYMAQRTYVSRKQLKI